MYKIHLITMSFNFNKNKGRGKSLGRPQAIETTEFGILELKKRDIIVMLKTFHAILISHPCQLHYVPQKMIWMLWF